MTVCYGYDMALDSVSLIWFCHFSCFCFYYNFCRSSFGSNISGLDSSRSFWARYLPSELLFRISFFFGDIWFGFIVLFYSIFTRCSVPGSFLYMEICIFFCLFDSVGCCCCFSVFVDCVVILKLCFTRFANACSNIIIDSISWQTDTQTHTHQPNAGQSIWNIETAAPIVPCRIHFFTLGRCFSYIFFPSTDIISSYFLHKCACLGKKNYYFFSVLFHKKLKNEPFENKWISCLPFYDTDMAWHGMVWIRYIWIFFLSNNFKFVGFNWNK